MAKRQSQRNKRVRGADTQHGGRILSGRSNWKRRAIWPVAVLVVAVAVVSAWAILKNSPQSSPKATSTNQPRAAATATKSENGDNPVSDGPRISVPEASYDFGTIAQGSKVSHAFVVRNIGNAPLRLIKAEAS